MSENNSLVELIEMAGFECLPLDQDSGWLGHIPFAAWLMKVFKPSVFVELGTHWGHSYFAFCKSAKNSDVHVKCYAVDLWSGDEHAGFYGDEVFDQVNKINIENYSNFSNLMKMPFEKAVEAFQDKSIELLHIDGLHTYEAVKNDFETWLPKLAPGAIVLFHDTEVRERDFEVWKYWEELQARYPDNITFKNSNGLGVLQIEGALDGRKISQLFPHGIPKNDFVRYFSMLGENVRTEFENRKKGLEAAALRQDNCSLEEELANARLVNGTLKNELANLRGNNRTFKDSLATLKQEFDAKDIQLNGARNEIQEIRTSTSWRITYPVRMVGRAIVRPRRYLFAISTLIRAHGGVVKLCGKVWKIYKISGLSGLANGFYGFRISIERNSLEKSAPQESVGSYSSWRVCFDSPDEGWIEKISNEPLKDLNLLLIIFFDKSTIQFAEKTLKGVLNLVGVRWQACVVLSEELRSSEVVSDFRNYVKDDARFVFNDSLNPEGFDVAILLAGDALLEEYSAHLFCREIQRNSGVSVVYSDEDRLSLNGELVDPWFKPNFSPLLAEQGLLWGGAVAFDLSSNDAINLVKEIVNGTSSPKERFKKYASRFSALSVSHIPHVLFHSQSATIEVFDLISQEEAILPLVSIIIPTRDMWNLLKDCLKSLEGTDWPKELIEIIIVDNGSTDSKMLSELRLLEAQGNVKVLRVDEEFNWSRLNNIGAQNANGEFLVFLNNDTEVLDSKWLRKIFNLAVMPDVGAVGCKLLFPDLTVQHGGVISGVHGLAGHAHLFLDKDEGGYRGLANITHEVIAVTGACLGVMRDKFESVGGFNERYKAAFNDVVFCFEQHLAGRRNVYMADPLLIHHESKSRGYDDSPEKIKKNIEDAMSVWEKYSKIMRSDPFYSPNLSLEKIYELGSFPRRRPAWDDAGLRPRKILMLSITHQIGHGVSVVIHQQAMGLVESGFDVIVAGPKSANDFEYPGCKFVELNSAKAAAKLAIEHCVDLVIAHTPPYFSVARWLGNEFPVVSYDYGEPPPEWFPDSEQRKNQLLEKDFTLTMAREVYTISDAIKAESRTPVTGVINLGNSHLGRWDESMEQRRNNVRRLWGWEKKHVIMNVCRFHRAERVYKGVDFYIEVKNGVLKKFPDLKDKIVFIICGKGNEKDVQEMKSAGLTVFDNVSDNEMMDLYAAADSYANFSRWEGYNLGIGQALAMGLPVLASDIPAHRAFGEKVINTQDQAVEWIGNLIASKMKARKSKIFEWSDHIDEFTRMVSNVCGE